MKIAICDDEKNFLTELKSKIYDYSNMHNWEPIVDIYDSGQKLVDCNIKYDIIILDYQMNDINGLETAKLLRNSINNFSCIIFLTSFPEIAIPAYDVDTYRFVVKDSLYKGLYKALDDFRNSIKNDYDISIKSNGEFITVNTESIMFIEVQNKCSYIHLNDGKILSTKNTLTNLYKTVPHTHFIKIHKAFIVNFKYITERGLNYVKIKNYAYELPISRNYLSTFKNAYYIYLKENQI